MELRSILEIGLAPQLLRFTLLAIPKLLSLRGLRLVPTLLLRLLLCSSRGAGFTMAAFSATTVRLRLQSRFQLLRDFILLLGELRSCHLPVGGGRLVVSGGIDRGVEDALVNGFFIHVLHDLLQVQLHF